MDLMEGLARTGLTGQEAALYLALCREGEFTGYEGAKVSGVSRSNAYLALSGLVEKGAAWKVEGEPATYVPVPPREYLAKVRRSMDEVLSFLEKGIPEARESRAPYLTITGRGPVEAKMKSLVEEARLRIYSSMAASETAVVQGELLVAAGRGVKLVLVCDRDPGVPGATWLKRDKSPGQVRMIADTEHVLIGQLGGDDSSCLYSRNAALVKLIKDSLTTEMDLIRLGLDGTEKAR